MEKKNKWERGGQGERGMGEGEIERDGNREMLGIGMGKGIG